MFTCVFVIPFTIVVMFGHFFQQKCSSMMLRFKLTPINDAYQGPYKVKYRWWTGLMLVIRSVLLLLFGVNVLGNPQINLLLIVSSCVLLLGVMWNLGTVYKHVYVNCLESFYIINLILRHLFCTRSLLIQAHASLYLWGLILPFLVGSSSINK